MLKIALLAADVLPFNSDEAVVALMARHILQGERPVFFYGQAYLGSLDAWLVAGAFKVLGESVRAVRLVQLALYLGTLVTTYLLGRRVFLSRWAATCAALLLALPTALVTLYTTATLGGYGETLLIGNILMLLVMRGTEPRRNGVAHWLFFGALAGIGFWGFGLVLVYLIPCVLLIVWASISSRHSCARVLNLFMAALGAVVGAWPWIGYAFQHGVASLAELGGIHVAAASPAGLLGGILAHAFNFLVFGLPVLWGLRPPWAIVWFGLPLAIFPIGLSIATLAHAARGLARRDDAAAPGRALLMGVCLTTIVGFVLTPFGADPSGRYFLPMAAPLALLTADMLNRVRRENRTLAQFGALGLVTFNLWGNARSALTYPPGVTTQFDAVTQIDHRYDDELIAFLLAQGETRGFTNYWVEFPIAFLSGEQVIFSAQLPYHLDFRYTPRDDRYEPYTQAVAASDRVAYITTNHPPLDARLRAGFAAHGVGYAERQIGDYRVFHNLSQRITPDDLGLHRALP